jgi:hypothetical protein
MRAIARTAQDLLQELALGSDEVCEIFFARALSFAQRQVAIAFMERNDYWIAPGARRPAYGTAIPFSRPSARHDADERADDEWPQPIASEDGLVAAELAGLRALVARPPKRRRAARAMLARAYAKLRAAHGHSDP